MHINNLKLILTFLSLLWPVISFARQYWSIDSTSKSIVYSPSLAGTHSDHIEMSGKKISTVLRYGVSDDGSFKIEKSFVWPMLRTIPNDTHGSLMRRSGSDIVPLINIDGNPANEKVEKISFDGLLSVESSLNDGLKLRRIYFPSVVAPAFYERFILTNPTDKDVWAEIPEVSIKEKTPVALGVDGEYVITSVSEGNRTIKLLPGESMDFSVVTYAGRLSDSAPATDAAAEENQRKRLVDELSSSLVLETPDEVINNMFMFSKLRACESIYDTKGGPMHGPGGEAYYAAIWANDEAEYANPLFPFTGYAYGNESAENSFRHFARWMNPEYTPIPSSIVAEGFDYWNGAGDRGDAAMIAYGASRYALAKGERAVAEELWPLIEWCLEYCKRQLNEDGVVKSDHDELEGRFPAGEANLCTSSLYYDALRSASMLAKELGRHSSVSNEYADRAAMLSKSIDRYFSGPVGGFDTYAYFKGNDVLRSWICIPLTVGIFNKADATIEALFSPALWTENGLLTQAGTETFWDRSTLYALRGVIHAGAADRALPYLRHYSSARLLGEHVPYAIEAWPEGNQRHLSAESALYARIFTEGVFGIRPTGFRSFELTPQLPGEWNEMSLRNIKAFGGDFDIVVKRAKSGKLEVRIIRDGSVLKKKVITAGDTVEISLA